MSIDKDKLSKLSPEERIKKLKLMEDERKKEVDEIGKLIKESMRTLATDKIAEEVAPGQRAVDISRLFESGNREGLERAAGKEANASFSMKGVKNYQTIAQTYEAYSQLSKFYSIVSMGGSLTEEQKAAIGQIGERINTAERYMTEGEKAVSKLDASRVVLYKLKKEIGLG